MVLDLDHCAGDGRCSLGPLPGNFGCPVLRIGVLLGEKCWLWRGSKWDEAGAVANLWWRTDKQRLAE